MSESGLLTRDSAGKYKGLSEDLQKNRVLTRYGKGTDCPGNCTRGEQRRNAVPNGFTEFGEEY